LDASVRANLRLFLHLRAQQAATTTATTPTMHAATMPNMAAKLGCLAFGAT
jgi:hypothetical protein